jgi:hypothetical protein
MTEKLLTQKAKSLGDKLEIIRNSSDINFIKNTSSEYKYNLKAENTYDAIVIGSGIEWLGS